MAKKKRAKPTKPSATLTEQIEQREQRNLLASAQKKGLQNLTANEKSAVRKHEESIFERVLSSCGKTLATHALGASPKVILDAMRNRGFPWPEGKRDRANLLEITRWLWRYFLDHPLPDYRGGKVSEDDMLLAGTSQELKDEFLRRRIAERDLIIRQKTMDLIVAEESHIPTEKVGTFAMGLAEVARKRSEDEQRKFEKQYGPEAAAEVAEMFEDFADACIKRFENEFGDGSECPTNEST